MVRLLVVIDGTGTGGAETSMAAMAPLLAKHDVELEVAYFHERKGAREKLADAEIPLFHVPVGRSRLLGVLRLRRLISQRRPNLVHTMVYEADVIGRTAGFLSRTPVMSSIINDMYGPEQLMVSAKPWKVRLAQVADIATARFVSQFHAITRTVADTMAPRLRIDRAKIEVVVRGRDQHAMGVRTDERRLAVRASLALGEEEVVILAVGRHECQKGLDTAIKALPSVLERNPHAILLIAGREGSVTSELQMLVDQLGISPYVRFLGHRSDVPDLLSAADVMIFPSLWEGLGGAVIEAMALECPVVCSDLPVLREVTSLEDGEPCARFFPPGDHVALAERVDFVLSSDPSRTEMRSCGRSVFEDRFTLSGVVEAYAALVKRVAASS